MNEIIGKTGVLEAEVEIVTVCFSSFFKSNVLGRSYKKEPKKSALDEIKEMNERKKELTNRKDYWMQPGIIVKVFLI